MPTGTSVKPESTPDTAIIRAFQQFLVPGVAVVHWADKRVTLAPEAARILRRQPGTELVMPVEALPPALFELASQIKAAGAAPICWRLVSELGNDGEAVIQVTSLGPGTVGAGVTVLLLNDLTPIRHLESRLLRLDRLALMGLVAADMAHEIKNSLVACRTFVQLLLEKRQEPELIDVVQRELARIEEIANRTLDYAAPPSPSTAPVHIHQILDYCLRLLQPQLESKAIVVERSFAEAPDSVPGNETELQQAFVNLVLNALEAMGTHGRLTVQTEGVSFSPGNLETENRRPGICVSINDTGTGIDSAHMARLFEPFFTTKPKGTGLGLAITRRIIREHGGRISVESTPGQGAQFRIFLPA